VGLVAAGVLLHWLGICPIVKRIWTSSYTLYSGGLILLVLAAIYYLMEIRGWTKWSFWLMVIGANSIVVYVMSWTIEHFVTENLLRHFGHAPFLLLGQAFEGMLRGATVLVVFWLVLHWMYKKRIFVRI
jgi:predicted acyltransferase